MGKDGVREQLQTGRSNAKPYFESSIFRPSVLVIVIKTEKIMIATRFQMFVLSDAWQEVFNDPWHIIMLSGIAIY